jgi:hypothetical protein
MHMGLLCDSSGVSIVKTGRDERFLAQRYFKPVRASQVLSSIPPHVSLFTLDLIIVIALPSRHRLIAFFPFPSPDQETMPTRALV